MTLTEEQIRELKNKAMQYMLRCKAEELDPDTNIEEKILSASRRTSRGGNSPNHSYTAAGVGAGGPDGDAVSSLSRPPQPRISAGANSTPPRTSGGRKAWMLRSHP